MRDFLDQEVQEKKEIAPLRSDFLDFPTKHPHNTAFDRIASCAVSFFEGRLYRAAGSAATGTPEVQELHAGVLQGALKQSSTTGQSDTHGGG